MDLPVVVNRGDLDDRPEAWRSSDDHSTDPEPTRVASVADRCPVLAVFVLGVEVGTEMDRRLHRVAPVSRGHAGTVGLDSAKRVRGEMSAPFGHTMVPAPASTVTWRKSP